jgi:hypothetical protein
LLLPLTLPRTIEPYAAGSRGDLPDTKSYIYASILTRPIWI